MSVLVAGGGITGLAAAHALGRAAVPVTLVDAEPRLGGKIETGYVDGFLVERGPDAFLATRPPALSLAGELGLADEVTPPREPHDVFVWHRERLVPVPEGTGLGIPTRLLPFASSALFSPGEKLRAALDLVLPPRAVGGDESIGTFLRRRFGDAVVERLAGPLISGVYGAGVDELSLDALMPRLREAERRHRSLLLAGLAARKANGSAPAGPYLVTLARGMGSLVDALAARLAGAEVRLGVGVARLERARARYLARLDDGSRIEADAVVLAMPAPAAARAVAELAPVASAALASITYRGTAAISLGYAASQLAVPLAGHGFVVPDGSLAIAACTWSSAKWPGRAPAGAVLVRATVRDDRLLAQGDDALADAAHASLVRALGIAGRPILVRVARWAGAMPRYTVGHLERVAGAEAALAAHPSILLAGAAYRGVGVTDCIAQGEAAAARILAAERAAA